MILYKDAQERIYYRTITIEEAGRLFRKTPPKEGFEVEGYVIRLAKLEERNKRKVTIASFIEDNPRKVSVELSESDHKLAIQAYKEGIRVVCYGNLEAPPVGE